MLDKCSMMPSLFHAKIGGSTAGFFYPSTRVILQDSDKFAYFRVVRTFGADGSSMILRAERFNILLEQRPSFSSSSSSSSHGHSAGSLFSLFFLFPFLIIFSRPRVTHLFARLKRCSQLRYTRGL